MDLSGPDLFTPPHNSILLRVVPSTATTVGGRLVIPHKGALDFLKNVTLSSTSRKTDTGNVLLDVVDEKGDDVSDLLEKSPGSTGIIIASSYGISLLLHDDPDDNVVGDDIVKLSHGCLLVLIETRNDPALFNVDGFVQRLQHVTGDTNLTLKEPPKLLYQECEGNFVTSPLKDNHARQILQALEKMEISFFLNDTNFPQIVSTIKKQAIGWVVWPRIFLYLLLDTTNKSKWASILHKLMPSLPSEERKLIRVLLENMKSKFGDFALKQELTANGVTTNQMMLIQPLISTILYGQLLSPFMVLSMCDILFKRVSLAAQKFPDNTCISRSIPRLSQQSLQKQVEFVLRSKPPGATDWTSHLCGAGEPIKVKPDTLVDFHIGNRTTQQVCWQVWNFPSNPAEKPSLLLPLNDATSVANLTHAGQNWPPRKGEVTFEMSDEGVESVVLFVWWRLESGDVQYERTAQQIHVAA